MAVEHDPYKVAFLPPPEEINLESPLTESQLLQSADEVFFYGVNSKSEYIIARIARGTNGEAEAWFYLKLSNGKVYQLQETSGLQQTGSDKRTFSCGDLQIHYLSPMRRWRIFFNGLLRETSDENPTSEKMVHVKLAVMTATAGSDVVQSGRPIFDDFFQHLWPYIGNNTANVVFQMVKRLWLIRIDQ
ncbi:phosphoenolpyruvate synthase [Trichonephila clavipes]|nr:phosphoenolpyruvate synthase [Trichonephila clavipes]